MFRVKKREIRKIYPEIKTFSGDKGGEVYVFVDVMSIDELCKKKSEDVKFFSKDGELLTTHFHEYKKISNELEKVRTILKRKIFDLRVSLNNEEADLVFADLLEIPKVGYIISGRRRFETANFILNKMKEKYDI